MGELEEKEESGRLRRGVVGKVVGVGVEVVKVWWFSPTRVSDIEAGVVALASWCEIGLSGVLNGDLNGLVSGFVVWTFLRFFGGDGAGSDDSMT